MQTPRHSNWWARLFLVINHGLRLENPSVAKLLTICYKFCGRISKYILTDFILDIFCGNKEIILPN